MEAAEPPMPVDQPEPDGRGRHRSASRDRDGGLGDRPADPGLDVDLTLLVAESRARDAIRARVRERHLRDAASADATLVGLLLDLAEGEQPLAIWTASGHQVSGRITLVARDAIAIATVRGPVAYVPTAGLATVRRLPHDDRSAADIPAGDRRTARDTTLAAIVTELAIERPRVTAAVWGDPAVLTGELRAGGADLLTLRLDGDPAVTAHVALRQVSLLTVLASG